MAIFGVCKHGKASGGAYVCARIFSTQLKIDLMPCNVMFRASIWEPLFLYGQAEN